MIQSVGCGPSTTEKRVGNEPENNYPLLADKSMSRDEGDDMPGDPDPATLRKPGDPVPKAEHGGPWTQEELNAMARSYDLSKAAENEQAQPPRASSEIPEHLRAGEADRNDPNLSPNRRSGEQETGQAYYPLYSSDAVRWGRNMAGLAAAARDGGDGNALAGLGYSEYQFRPNGTFRYYAVIFAEKVVSEGDYEMRDGTITIIHRRIIKANNPKQMLSYLSYGTYQLGSNSTTGRREFSIEIHNYLEDFYWDRKGYRDSSGQRFHIAGSKPNGSREMSRKAAEDRKECAEKLFYHRQNLAKTGHTEGGPGEFECPSPPHRKYKFDPATLAIRCEYHRH